MYTYFTLNLGQGLSVYMFFTYFLFYFMLQVPNVVPDQQKQVVEVTRTF